MLLYCNNNAINMIDTVGSIPKFTAEFLNQFLEWVETPLGLLRYVTYLNGGGYLYEVWFDVDNNPRWSRHHTNHGYPSKHTEVPHDHDWYVNDKGNYQEDSKWVPPDPRYSKPNSKDDSKNNSGNQSEDNSFDDNTSNYVIGGATVVGSLYFGYVGVKWLVAVLAAPYTGGGSLVIAGATP
jgi:hypothetical protein